MATFQKLEPVFPERDLVKTAAAIQHEVPDRQDIQNRDVSNQKHKSKVICAHVQVPM